MDQLNYAWCNPSDPIFPILSRQWDKWSQNVHREEEKVYWESTGHTSTLDISKDGMNYHYHEQAVPLDKESDFEAMECLQQLVDIPQRSKCHSRKNN